MTAVIAAAGVTQAADPMTDREALAEGMRRVGKNAAQVASDSGVGVATVYDYLAGKVDPRVSKVDAMLEAVGVEKRHKLPKATGKEARGPGRPPAEH